MRIILIAILYITTIPAYCQTNKSFNKLKHFVLDTYPKNKSSIYITHSIDTVIKLRNGNYFVLVLNELKGASNAESGTYDCYEIRNTNNEFEVEKSILNNGDNTGGMGMVDLTYRLVYLNKNDYLLIANKNFIHHGNYNLLSLIVNAEKKYLEILATNDYSGITGDSSSNLNQITKIYVSKGNFKKLRFKNEKYEVSKDISIRDVLISKIYEIKVEDFNMDLECITSIKLLSQKKLLMD